VGRLDRPKPLTQFLPIRFLGERTGSKAAVTAIGLGLLLVINGGVALSISQLILAPYPVDANHDGTVDYYTLVPVGTIHPYAGLGVFLFLVGFVAIAVGATHLVRRRTRLSRALSTPK